MEKSGEKIFFEEDLEFISQMNSAILQSFPKLEKSFEEKDYNQFAEIKKFMAYVQDHILETLK